MRKFIALVVFMPIVCFGRITKESPTIFPEVFIEGSELHINDETPNNSLSALSVELTELRCEYRENPLGIDVAKPRLNWIIKSGQRGEMQTAYEVLVASSQELLFRNEGNLWTSGKVLSDQSVHVEYQGKPLESMDQCWWKVRIWDKDGKPSNWSQPATWTMGLLNPEDWKAKWIGSEKEYPSLMLRRDFSIKPGMRRATVAVCGLGQYEMTINGAKVSEDVLTPGWTKYNKTILYDVYDITSYLNSGNNTVGFFLGNGMYNVAGGRYAKFIGSFGPQKVIAQVRMEFEDGTTETLITNEQWRVHFGPVTFTCVYGGEDYDAQLFEHGWDQPGFCDSHWISALETKGPGGILKGISCSAPPVRLYDTISPVKITRISPGVTLYDLGQNAAQMPGITVSGPAGSSVKILPSEIVKADNSIDQTSIGGDISCTYTLDGIGMETWSPRFFYVGYRYLQVNCIAASDGGDLPVLKSLESRVVHTSSAPIGEFVTSNDLINRIFTMIRWAQRSNMVSVMTDCPHREKLGWLEQTHLNGSALRYNYNLNSFFSKLMNDIADSQLDNGLVPEIAPEYPVFSGDFRDSPEWGSAFMQVAWHQYQFAGDKELLSRYYNAMARYLAYLESKATNHILAYGLGDWRQLELTPKAVTATTIFYDDALILARMAAVLGKTDDAERYNQLAKDIRMAFNQQFFDPETHEYATGSQTSNAIPLDMGMVPEEHRQAVFENLVRHLETNGLKAGEIGFPYLLRALAKGGRSDLIFSMINQTDKPGYGFQLNNGATSLPEDWDYQPSNSQNHFMLGHITEWFYHDLAGIQLNSNVLGFRKIVLNPKLIEELSWVKGSYQSLYGLIKSDWEIREKVFHWNVSVPPNTSAIVYIPASDKKYVMESNTLAFKTKGVKYIKMCDQGAMFEVGSGDYSFSSTDYEKYRVRSIVVPVTTITTSGKDITKADPVIISTNTEGAVIRFTLDGTEPTENSQEYTGPFTLEHSVIVKARSFKKGLPPGYVVQSDLDVYNPKMNGLNYEYFTGKWEVLPDFDLLKPLKKGVVSNLNMDQIKETDNLFGIRFNGWINIPREGSYTFHMRSDDGSAFYIDENQVVENDGLHGDQERTGQIRLTAGKHPIIIGYFQAGNGKILDWTWEGPGIKKRRIVASDLFIAE